MIRFILMLGLLLSLLNGCTGRSSGDLPTVEIQLGTKSYTLEVADEPLERETGLMRRDEMPSDHGMIFVFPDEQPRRFWMKNTRIPLDILFISSSGRIVSISTMKPYVGEAESGDAAKYVIELNAGEASKSGVKIDGQIQIPKAILTLSGVR